MSFLSPFQPVDPRVSFPKLEEEILRFWKTYNCFQKSLEIRESSEKFTFYDGPPFATGLPHYGHILAGTIKDVIPRYQTMLGKYVPRRFGWDCHGVPVEHEMEKQLGFKNKNDIEAYGVQNFCESCRGIVLKYTEEWQKTVERMGRWVDFKKAYKTMDPGYMETILGVFSRLWNEEYIYEGKKVVAYSPKLASTLSNFEANLNYKDIDDPAVTVQFELEDEPNTFLLAWTTTPWTLASNLGLCVHPQMEYVQVEYTRESTPKKIIIAKNLLPTLFKEKNLLTIFSEEKNTENGMNIYYEKVFHGSELIGKKYKPLFPFLSRLHLQKGKKHIPSYDFSHAFRVFGDEYVSDSDGTGIVHLAPTGEDDARILQDNNVPLIYPFTPSCYFDETIPELQGKYFRYDPVIEGSKENNANTWIIRELKNNGSLLKREQIRHSYPHCWRTDCALMYRGVHTFFVNIQKIKKRLIENNRDIHWIPNHIKNGRFGKILENAPDWAISRNRYWGAPIPVWKCKKCDHIEVASSVREIGEKAKKEGSIFVVRHGEGEHNQKKILSSSVDDAIPLTKKGQQQAKEIGEKLKGRNIDFVFSSPLLRTRQTTEKVLEACGEQKEVYIDQRIREIDAGDMNEKSLEEWNKHFKKGPKFTQNPHNGESYADVEKRVRDFLMDIREKYKHKNILVVAHGVVLRIITKYFLFLEEEETLALPLPPGEMREFSFTQLPVNTSQDVDLHRPYIDEIVFDCSKCNGDMHRVSDVLDCWFESGSMPYASQTDNTPLMRELKKHYSSLKKNTYSGFPADFIAEGLDQTRGWFYTLHTLGNIIFGKPTFKNVVVNGIVLAEDGQKMSKSKKNYPDPKIIFDTYGADAMRFYLMNSPAVRADDLCFSEKGVSEVLRKTLLPLWNAYSFFVTYANIDKWQKPKKKYSNNTPPQFFPKNKLDRWILTELRYLVEKFREKMNTYEIDAACREIPYFLDHLTNFYIRRSRRRFWKAEITSDKEEAFHTLYEVLRTISQVLAPISPFITEKIWQNLRQEHEETSIHHCSFPSHKYFPKENKLQSEILAVRTIISLALSIRSTTKIRVRQPLSVIKIALPPSLPSSVVLENIYIIQEEINVKSVEVSNEPGELGTMIAKPDAKKLGPRFGKDIQHIIREAKQGNLVQNDDGTYTIDKWKVDSNELEIGFLGKEGLNVESEKGIVVALDTHISPELREEGIAREIIRHIQELRKIAKYHISDRIDVKISGVNKVVKNYGESLIKPEVLAQTICEEMKNPDEEKEVNVEGEFIQIAVRR
jgi:isoleucyl-tRNA synthetase